MRTLAAIGTLAALAGTAVAEEDLAVIARDGALARLDPLAELSVAGATLDDTGIERVRVIEHAQDEVRGLLCDRAACLVVEADDDAVRTVLQEPVTVELGDHARVDLATGATLRGDSYYESLSLRVHVELVGAPVGTDFTDDEAAPFQVTPDLVLPAGTWLHDDDRDGFAQLLAPLPVRVIKKKTALGALVEVTDGSAKVVGYARAIDVRKGKYLDLASVTPKPKKRRSPSTRLLAGTVLYAEPGGAVAGVALRNAAVLRVDGDDAWSDWTAWSIVVDGVTATVWTEGEPIVKKANKKKTNQPAGVKRK